MSYFLCDTYNDIEPYVPGERVNSFTYLKLNANETYMSPSKKVLEAITPERINGMGFYSDPDCLKLRIAIGELFNMPPEQVFVGNGADEVLGFCFMSFFSPGMKICFPDITYDFYRTYSKTFKLDMERIPLKEDLQIDVEAFVNSDRDVVLANPNNPTGLKISVEDIERIVSKNEKRMVIIDEAYVDYGAETSIPLVNKYSNLVVVHTFSKSRNMAGARLGYAISNKDIIDDMNKIKFTFNPFNLSTLAMAAGIASINDKGYLRECIETIIANREYTKESLEEMRFKIVESHTNFLFMHHDAISAKELCQKLRENNILVRHYDLPRINDYIRITIGTKKQMEHVVDTIEEILISHKNLCKTKLFI